MYYTPLSITLIKTSHVRPGSLIDRVLRFFPVIPRVSSTLTTRLYTHNPLLTPFGYSLVYHIKEHLVTFLVIFIWKQKMRLTLVFLVTIKSFLTVLKITSNVLTAVLERPKNNFNLNSHLPLFVLLL